MSCASCSPPLRFLHLFSPSFSSTRSIKSPNKPYLSSSKNTSNRSSPTAKTLAIRCSSSESEQPSPEPPLRDLISGMVDERVENLLKSKENKLLLDDLEKATQRVSDARTELAEIEKQERDSKLLKDYVRKLETRTSEIAESQREILEARAMLEEADRALSLNIDEIRSGDGSNNSGTYEFDEVERLESVKASTISALVGTLAGLPISLSQSSSTVQLTLHLAVNFISCALFGITFRYAVRRDLDNIQLKTGVSAAFGFVKGLGELEAGPPLELDSGSFLSHAVDGAVYISENLFIFIFASIGLDYCFKMGLLSPFPVKRLVSGNSGAKNKV